MNEIKNHPWFKTSKESFISKGIIVGYNQMPVIFKYIFNIKLLKLKEQISN